MPGGEVGRGGLGLSCCLRMFKKAFWAFIFCLHLLTLETVCSPLFLLEVSLEEQRVGRGVWLLPADEGGHAGLGPCTDLFHLECLAKPWPGLHGGGGGNLSKICNFIYENSVAEVDVP